MYMVGPIDGPEQVAVHHAGMAGPRIECHPDRRRHRNGTHPPVLSEQVHDTPPTIPLPDVAYRECRNLVPSRSPRARR
jgi:hypothetical protein